MAKAAIVIGVNKTGDLPVLRDAAAGAGRVAEWLTSEGYHTQALLDEKTPGCFINGNSKSGFIDLRKPGMSSLGFRLKLRAMRSKGQRAPVYIGEHNGQKEYWFTDGWFAKDAGGEASALKKELFGGGLLEADRRGKGFSYTVKRRLPDRSRPYFVVVRHKRKKL